MHAYIYTRTSLSRSLSLSLFRSNVYADRKHINCRPHSDGADDYYCNYYDTKVLFFLR